MNDTTDASQGPVGPPDTPSSKKTRTLAILKPHVLKHRLTIEPRIIEAGFDIVKERMMQFDSDSDRDYLDELFGADAATLIGEPVWVYVLERHRAVEVWLTLMGHPDPEVARETAPNSLRAIYGKSVGENAVAGPPDLQTAEAQILALFASSPPFPPLDSKTNSIRSIASSILLELQQAGEGEEEGLQDGRYSEGGSPSIASTARKSEREIRSTSTSRKSSFKARALPASTVTPTIEPRMSRAAALRLGLPDPTVRKTSSNGERSKTFENVPGHKRSVAIKVASTAAPAIQPRLTKAASLRMGIKDETEKKPIRPKLTRPSTAGGTTGGSFEGVPGHKRRETISVASTKDPNILPRINRSALLRQQKDVAPPTSHMFKLPASAPLQNEKPPVRPPSAARRESIVVPSTRPPSAPPRANRSSMLRVAKDNGGGHAPSSFRQWSGKVQTEEETGGSGAKERGGTGLSRSSSTRSLRTGRSSSMSVGGNGKTAEPGGEGEGKKTVASRGPSIAPRSNRSAMLRAATMEKPGTNTRTGEPKFGRAFK